MKKTIVLLVAVLMSTTSLVQAQARTDKESSNEQTQKKQSYAAVVYQLFPTQNMWNFLKLNTQTGQIWQVQYDVEGSDRFETILSSQSLVTKEKEVIGRFTLYSTQNKWTFLLLDQ